MWEHSGELLHRTKIALVALFVASFSVSAIPVQITPNYIPLIFYVFRKMKDLLPEGVELMAVGWVDILWIYVLLSLLLGFIASSPVIAYEAYKFLAPALHKHEKRMVLWFIFSFTILFIFGAVFSYSLILPITYRVLVGFIYTAGAVPLYSVLDFFTFTILAIFAVGLLFTFPVFSTLLIKMGLISPDYLASKRREALVGLLILTAIITPDATGITMLMLFIPMIVLFELAVQVGKRVQKPQVQTGQ